jgi:hypothetical protein
MQSIKTIYDCVPACEAREFTDKDYNPSCSTPLYDAMVQTLIRPTKTSSTKRHRS